MLTQHLQVGRRAAPSMTMRGHRHIIAKGLARALQAGPAVAHGLRARAHACCGPALWLDAVVQGLLDTPRRRWTCLDLAALASLIERSDAFQAAWHSDDPPQVRRYILRPPSAQGAPPIALQDTRLPFLPAPGDVAKWLGISPAALWRLTLPAPWQRRRPLGDQHYLYRWRKKAEVGWRLIEAPQGYLKAL